MFRQNFVWNFIIRKGICLCTPVNEPHTHTHTAVAFWCTYAGRWNWFYTGAILWQLCERYTQIHSEKSCGWLSFSSLTPLHLCFPSSDFFSWFILAKITRGLAKRVKLFQTEVCSFFSLFPNAKLRLFAVLLHFPSTLSSNGIRNARGAYLVFCS